MVSGSFAVGRGSARARRGEGRAESGVVFESPSTDHNRITSQQRRSPANWIASE